MRLMLDTNAYSGFKRGNPAIVQALKEADEILIPIPVLGELRSGFRSGKMEGRNLSELDAVLSSPRVRVQALGEETAIFYAEVHGALRAAGKPIPTNDVWIAASALESGSILLTMDEHFNAITGLLRRP